MPVRLSVAVVLCALLGMPSAVFAATLSVDPSDSAAYSTLSEAVSAASSGDTITVAAGTYAEDPIAITTHLTIVGAGSGSTTIGCGDVLFTIGGDEGTISVAIQGVRLESDGASRVVLATTTDLSLDDVAFVGPSGLADHGGALAIVDGSLELSNTSFTSSSVAAGYAGGHIWASGAPLTVVDSTFSDGEAQQGGSIYSDGGDVTISNSRFDGNSAADAGGALYVLDGSVAVDASTFSSNTVTESEGVGGALYHWAPTSSALEVSTSTFDANSAHNAGAIYADTVEVTVLSSTFTSNEADTAAESYGGAVWLSTTAPVLVSTSTFSDNAGLYGGGLYLLGWRSQGIYEVTGNRFEANSGTTGAGLYVETAGQVRVSGNTFTSNAAGDAGGGLALYAVTDLAVTDNLFCTNAAVTGGAAWLFEVGADGTNDWQNNRFVENAASDRGGALYQTYGDSPTVLNNTFVANEAATDGGGALYDDDVGFDFRNNLVAWTAAGDGVVSTSAAGTYTIDYDDFWSNSAADLGAGLALGTGNLALDPELSAFTDDGDCDDDELWQVYGSPLVDAGDPSILDPDGSTSDIGAYGGPGAAPELFTDTDADGTNFLQDCDDTDADAHPGATEIPYDGVDQDCSGADLADVDGDGFDAEVAGGDDCDDDDGQIHPDAAETWYDGIDQDCDGNDTDQDGDGDPAAAHGGDDCDDTDATVSSLADETWYDGVDQDCDGGSDYDQDGDGYDSDAHGGDDCDDTSAEVRPGGTEIAYDGVDQDCESGDLVDVDGDGFDAEVAGGDDCDDEDATINPGATEIDDDEIDNDCDGEGGRTPDDTDPADTDPADTGSDTGKGCGCSSAAPVGSVGLLGLVSLLGLRRRSR